MIERGQNMLKNRDRANIEKIEACFKAGPLAEAMSRAPQIERRGALTPQEFAHEYRERLRPVVVEGLLEHWPALTSWSFDYLASKCGDATVVVDSYSSLRARDVSFREFADMISAGVGPNAAPIYLQEWLYMASCPDLAEDLPELPIAQYDFRRDLYGERISTNHQLWMGQRGATTRVHQDAYFVDVMHAQIVGEKYWCVMSPMAHLGADDTGSLLTSALIDDPETQLMQCVLRPGDVLYLPSQWWHRIELRSDSIGLGRKCLDQVNLQKHTRARFSELLALALNHEQVKEAYPELYRVVVLRNRALAKLLDIDLSRLRP